MPTPSSAPRAPRAPRDVVVVLLDSLNRHMIGAYGGEEFHTPNLDLLAKRSVRFTNHHTGSLPCMPARHDLLVGALDFPWRPWGSIEVWEDAFTTQMRRDAGVSTMLVSDHPHLFESGGENYHHDFGAWDYLRGGEDDPWRTRADASQIGAPNLPPFRESGWRNYDLSRTFFREEADFPGPRTMTAAAKWLDQELGADRRPEERAFLLVDEFDPHEPFDAPERWANLYDSDWEGERIIWPPYTSGVKREDAFESPVLSEREGRQIRSQYGAKLSMIDHWLGVMMETVDRHDAWETTAFILCTDHGVYLGERGMWGKPAVSIYPELGHIPLMISWPGVDAGTCDALTTTVDIHATICDAFGITPKHEVHGHSLVPLIEGRTKSIREWALSGVWGREVHIANATSTFAKAPVEANRPLSMYSNRWSTMPVRIAPNLHRIRPNMRATLERAPGGEVPVIRQPFDPSDSLPFWARGEFHGDLLYNRFEPELDGGVRNISGGAETREMTELLAEALRAIDAPDEQLSRLGIA
ncbi:MAG: sulfatase-like hydrolase/transferase [Actinobacteria bacterium]|nr:sulfatase-like hydrolase/transferase [Actinomycetota bacterium]